LIKNGGKIMDYYFQFTANEILLIMEALNDGQHKKVVLQCR